MFRGNHPARVDEKGRLKIPADFKRRVDELYGPQFFITSKDGKRAELYPLKEWERIEDALAKAPSSAAKKKFLDVTNYYGQVVELDGQGRILVPPILRETAQMRGDVDVLGNLTYLEIWNHTRFLDNLKASPITDEDEQTLDGLGI